MELKKGMWVITNDRMELGQIKDFCTCEKCEKRGFYEPIITNHIYITDYDKSRSFHGYKFYDNLIDLIEAGDYVNGYKVLFIDAFFNKGKNVKCINNEEERVCFYEEDIKDIITKEQFNSMKYVVERDK